MKNYSIKRLVRIQTLLLLAGVLLHTHEVFAQDTVRKIQIINPANSTDAAIKTALLKAQPLNTIPEKSPNLDTLTLAILTPIAPPLKEENILFRDFERFKDTAKLIYDTTSRFPTPRQSTSLPPVISAITFDVNSNDREAPLDNSIAVSDSGFIVSATNGIIEYYEENRRKYRKYLLPFFKGNVGRPCDPKVIFDPSSKRFIVFGQSCDGVYNNSNIILGFSATSNPSDGWYFYRIKISGHPFVPNQWFDFPKIGISTDGLFLMGNIYQHQSGSNTFVQSVVYQIDKESGYKANTLDYKIWYNFQGSPAVLMPVSYGHNGVYGPGIFLIGTSFQRFANHIKLYDISGSIHDDSVKVKYYEIPTSTYTFFAKAFQKHLPIDNGDIRIQDAFYSDGKIVHVFTSGDNRNFSRINLNILDLSTMVNRSQLIGDELNSSYAYPSVMPISEPNEPLRIVVQYNSTSNQTFPDIRYKVCDESLQCFQEVIARNGENMIFGYDRWGDYSSISRDYSMPHSLWLSSSYGNAVGSRQASITNVVPRDIGSNITGTITKVGNKIFRFKVSRKTPVVAFLISGQKRTKIFEGTAWPGGRQLSLVTENLQPGEYTIEIRNLNSNSVIKSESFAIE